MPLPIHLRPQAHHLNEDHLTVAVDIETAPNETKRLWYRLPAQYQEWVSRHCDPFVIATLMWAMSQQRDLVVHGSVSTNLLRHLEEFQMAWQAWQPHRLRRIEIIVEETIRPMTLPAATLVAFSGGIDSAFSAFRPYSCQRRSQDYLPTAGLMVHGFDIPLTDAPAFEGAKRRSETMLNSLGMTCIPLATNFREVIPVGWEDCFGTATAACLTLLNQGFSVGLIASSYAYRALSFPYGSNPISDPLLSSDTFKVIHDGAGYSRFEKIQLLSTWPEALQNLRVCWQGDKRDRNCGRCEKCVRNILNFRLAGVGLPPCFEEDVSDGYIQHLRLRGGALDAMTVLHAFATQQQPHAAWVKSLKIAIRRNQYLNLFQRHLPTASIPLKQFFKQQLFSQDPQS